MVIVGRFINSIASLKTTYNFFTRRFNCQRQTWHEDRQSLHREERWCQETHDLALTYYRILHKTVIQQIKFLYWQTVTYWWSPWFPSPSVRLRRRRNHGPVLRWTSLMCWSSPAATSAAGSHSEDQPQPGHRAEDQEHLRTKCTKFNNEQEAFRPK